MTLRLGEVVLIRMQFHEATGAKVRPAVVLLDTGDSDFVAAPVTSKARTSEFDLTIAEWRPAGLNVASSIRIHKLSVLAKSEIVRTLGTLTDSDRASLAGILCRAFCPQPERE
jgi:mRNA-degrading endonuclease toxin of MazEF toxin-antitoxin module